MKNLLSKIVVIFAFSGLLFSGMPLYSQAPEYLCVAKNDTLISPYIYQFDVYIFRTGTVDLYLNNQQVSFKIQNTPEILNGGTLTAQYVSGSTELPDFLIPRGANILPMGNYKYVRLDGAFPTTSGALIPTTGLRIGSIRIINTHPFGQSRMALIPNSGVPANTVIYAIVPPGTTGSFMNITNMAWHTVDLTDPVLNKSPVTFSVTGGGSTGAAGCPVGLSSSETGVKYQLMKNSVPVGVEVIGTGSPVTIGLVAETGSYSVQARRTATYLSNISMNGSTNLRKLHVQVLLEGLYDGMGLMRKSQDESGDKFPGNVADKISLSLKDANPPYDTRYEATDLDLSTDGNVLSMYTLTEGTSFYISVKHRNHVEVWSALPLTFDQDNVYYNFTDNASSAYGDNMKNDNGKFVLWCGDISTSGIDYPTNPEPDGMLSMDDEYYLYDSFLNGDFGYSPMDINGDGMVNQDDMYLQYANYLRGIFAITP